MATPPPNKPEGWRISNLTQLLTPDQIRETARILSSSTDPLEQAARLKQFYATFAEELIKKGSVADYLAYAVVESLHHQYLKQYSQLN